jgi:hypothetical protein
MKTILALIVAALVATASAQLIPQTPLQRNMAKLAQTSAGSVYYAELAATALNGNNWIWSLPDAELSEFLTALGQQNVTQLLALWAAQAESLNAGLAAAGSTVRANATPTRTWTWVNGVAVVDPLPSPEPTPEEPQE